MITIKHHRSVDLACGRLIRYTHSVVTLAWASLLFASGLPLMGEDKPDESRFLSHTRQLILEGRRSGEGYFSSDGKALVFQSEREPDNPFYQIYLLDLESGDINRVSPGFGKTTCAFLRPGTDDVLFASSHLDVDAKAKQKSELEFRASGKQRRYSWDYDETYELFTAKRDGSGLKRLSESPGYDAEGSYSPDGRLIVYCSLRAAYPKESLSPEDRKRLETDPAWFGDIYLMNADGSNPRRLTSTPGYDGGPFFTPDGQRIVWRRFDQTGAIADIYTMKLDGSDVRRVTDFKSMSWAPYFHPSGRYVIFASNKLGFSNFELYMVDADGAHEPVRVTTHDGFDGLPVFSPNGKQIAWTSNRTPQGNSHIFLADWSHDAALAALEASPRRGTVESPGSIAAVTTAIPPAHTPAGLQASPDISEADLRSHVAYLASDALEGRLTGTPGASKAADYIADQLRRAGLQPLGDNGTFFQSFEFTAGVNVVTNENRFQWLSRDHAPTDLQLNKDFRPLSLTANGTAEGEVVFAGYGLFMPPGEGPGYDSYAGLNVSNKIVMVLRYVPEGVDTQRRQALNRYAGLRYKALIARNRGARALLVVTGPNSPNAGELTGFTYDTTQAGSGIISATISGQLADRLFAGSGRTLKDLQTGLDNENPHAETSLVLTNARVRFTTSVKHVKQTDRNVLAWIPPSKERSSQEIVLVGAHYDHLGHGETGGFARKDEEGQIHNGADDNASGTAGVLEIAAAMSHERQQNPNAFDRGIVFALWSGEELGLLGSAHYTEHPALPLSNTVVYVNFDMIGRLRENKITLNGIGSSGVWRKLLEKRNVAAGFNLQLLDDPFPPTDVTSFYPKGVPVLAFFTGTHEEYHRPADKASTLNYEGAERVSRFAKALIKDLANASARPDYLTVERSDKGGSSRETLRAYLGTIPDYATEVTGVKLSGARGGSPADKAGLKTGDIIVEFAGQKIANIYDYTYALDAVKIGQPIKIVVLRDGKKVELTATPEARK